MRSQGRARAKRHDAALCSHIQSGRVLSNASRLAWTNPYTDYREILRSSRLGVHGKFLDSDTAKPCRQSSKYLIRIDNITHAIPPRRLRREPQCGPERPARKD